MLSFTRRDFCLASAAIRARPAMAASAETAILLTSAQGQRIRTALQRDTALGDATLLRANADRALKAGPWSVTTARPEHVNAGPNDYYSEGPYWWPNPENPSGPYIRKDGQRYPGRFKANHDNLGRMATAVLDLGAGACFTGDRKYADRAGLVLSTWFVEPKTRMNPNLEFGQAIHGVTTGRGTGIIDTVSLIHAAQGVALLEQADALDTSIGAGVRRWYADYLHWMTTSKKGLDEKNSGNNHATWWTAQAAAYAVLTADASAQKMAWDHYRNYLVPDEIRPGGSCPREEARTNSLGYSTYNLDAFATLCRVAETNGVDLWRYRTAKGIGLEKCFDYLMPYVLHAESWRKQQISKFSAEGLVSPGLGALGLHSDTLAADWRALPHAHSTWVQLVNLLVKTEK